MTRQHDARGFTLFELLVAVTILAVVAAIAYTGLIQVENSRKRIDDVETHLSQIQLTFLNFERDIEQVVHRPIRNTYGTEQPSIVGQGEYLMALTRGGLPNPAHVARSNLERVAYVVEDDNLERLSWTVLDQAQDTVPVKRILLKKVDSVDIQFLDQSGDWSEFWPPQNNASSGTSVHVPDEFPRAVSVILKLKDIGTIKRIFLMPEA